MVVVVVMEEATEEVTEAMVVGMDMEVTKPNLCLSLTVSFYDFCFSKKQ